MTARLVALLMLVAGIATSGAGAVAPPAARQCVPPLGPGDNARHSSNLRVTNIGCETGRRVALRCARFSYGQSGTCTAVGYRWRCTSTKASGLSSVETCVSGRRSLGILWTD